MLLRNLHSVLKNELTNINIRDGKIDAIGKGMTACGSGRIVNFEDAIVFPGIINSHDHLDFNLYPQLGNRHYNNYVEWGNDIHKHNKDIINNIKKVPLHLRVKWGIYKNLLNGVTTVVNHGQTLNAGNDLITVFEKCNVIHSVQFQRNWKQRINQPGIGKRPFVIHVGEGVDNSCTSEINSLIKWNLFGRKMVGVHGIAMTEQQAKHFMGLVWCPASNEFLIGTTARIDRLKYATTIVFGTDATLSASWNMWEHIRMARNTDHTTDHELLDMLTVNAARLWNLSDCGALNPGCDADIVIARKKQGGSAHSFFNNDPEDILMVLSKGKIKLFDSELLPQLDNRQFPMSSFSSVQINNSYKYVYGNLSQLIHQIKDSCPEVNLPVAAA